MRSIEMLLTEGFKVNVLRMPTDEDPDEYVRAHGADKFLALLKTTQPYIEYIIDIASAGQDLSRPAGKVEAINAILPHLARMRDRFERLEYAAQIADRFKVDSRTIREELKRTATSGKTNLDQKRLNAAQEITLAERQLLELLLGSPEVRRMIVPNLSTQEFENLATGSIFAAVIEAHNSGAEADFSSLSEKLESESDLELLPALLMSDLAWAGETDFDTLFKKATEALSSLRRRELEKKLDVIQIEIGQAEREQDTDRYLRLYQEKSLMKKRLLALAD
jgi:DNA primase